MQLNIKASIHHSIQMDWKKFCKRNNWLVGGWMCARRHQTWSFSSFLWAVHSSSLLQGHCPSSSSSSGWGGGVGAGRWKRWDWGGREVEGEEIDEEGVYAAPAALLVSSMAADTCSASSAPHFHPGWGEGRGGSSLDELSSRTRRGPAVHQWCLCCSSGGHLLAESESRSTLGMELSSPRYQDWKKKTHKKTQK